MFDNTGNHLSSWGSDGKGPQQLHKPEDIAVGTEGDVYVTDTRNSRIQVLNVVE
jgi:DNA-binding beta-propeller fold protein YncE